MQTVYIEYILFPVQRWKEDALCELVDNDGHHYSNLISSRDTGKLGGKVLTFESDVWQSEVHGVMRFDIKEIRLTQSKAVFTMRDERVLEVPLRAGDDKIKTLGSLLCYYLATSHQLAVIPEAG